MSEPLFEIVAERGYDSKAKPKDDPGVIYFKGYLRPCSGQTIEYEMVKSRGYDSKVKPNDEEGVIFYKGYLRQVLTAKVIPTFDASPAKENLERGLSVNVDKSIKDMAKYNGTTVKLDEDGRYVEEKAVAPDMRFKLHKGKFEVDATGKKPVVRNPSVIAMTIEEARAAGKLSIVVYDPRFDMTPYDKLPDAEGVGPKKYDPAEGLRKSR